VCPILGEAVPLALPLGECNLGGVAAGGSFWCCRRRVRFRGSPAASGRFHCDCGLEMLGGGHRLYRAGGGFRGAISGALRQEVPPALPPERVILGALGNHYSWVPPHTYYPAGRCSKWAAKAGAYTSAVFPGALPLPVSWDRVAVYLPRSKWDSPSLSQELR
jgi:hypothetical protein